MNGEANSADDLLNMILINHCYVLFWNYATQIIEHILVWFDNDNSI